MISALLGLTRMAVADYNHTYGEYQGITYVGHAEVFVSSGGADFAYSSRDYGLGSATWLYSSFKIGGTWYPQSTFASSYHYLYHSPTSSAEAVYGEHWISNGIGNYSPKLYTFTY